jgi:hypothetical protein
MFKVLKALRVLKASHLEHPEHPGHVLQLQYQRNVIPRMIGTHSARSPGVPTLM